jgi:hypothetical protein
MLPPQTVTFTRRIYIYGSAGGNCLCKGKTLIIKGENIWCDYINVYTPFLTGFCNTCGKKIMGYMKVNPLVRLRDYNLKCDKMGLPNIDHFPTDEEITEMDEKYLIWEYRIGGEKWMRARNCEE